MTLLFQFSHSHFFPIPPFLALAVIQVAYIVLVFFFISVSGLGGGGRGCEATSEKLESMTFFECGLAGVITAFFEGNRGAECSNFPDSHT